MPGIDGSNQIQNKIPFLFRQIKKKITCGKFVHNLFITFEKLFITLNSVFLIINCLKKKLVYKVFKINNLHHGIKIILDRAQI